MANTSNVPKLPKLLDRKIYKSGQTRGADDDVIYQNRVNRNNTVLIPFHIWEKNPDLRDISNSFEKGYIVLINPDEYYAYDEPNKSLIELGLTLGENCLLFYETRNEWNNHNPLEIGLNIPTQRENPLGGEFVARVPATTAIENGKKINMGYTETNMKGAGIRLYEYASAFTIKMCQLQLEAIFWLCEDSITVVQEYEMTKDEAELRKSECLKACESKKLLDYSKLKDNRIIDSDNNTICPLCLKKLSGYGFFNRMSQAEGREVPDLTVTEINLFHVDELKYGKFNHKPYNLGWGHHHCNVVVKDSGIQQTLEWLKSVLERNGMTVIDNNIEK